MMIMGIPNVGKSTLMNVVLQRKLAKVGDEPAVTRAQQTSQLDVRHSITDTPGLLWPKIEHPSDGLMLAASHAVGRNAMIDEEVATFLAGLLLARYPACWRSATASRPMGSRASRCRGGHRRDRQTPACASVAAKPISRRQRRCCCRITGTVLLGRISLETPLTRSAMLAAEQTQTAIRGTALDDGSAAAHA
jgi:ribosome biogenesis GTPase A